jgi:membrane protein
MARMTTAMALAIGVISYRRWRQESTPSTRSRRLSSPSQPPSRPAAHGREAVRPGQIPARGWIDVFNRVRLSLAEDNLSIVAAGVAFYGLLAIVPALAAIVAIYGLFVSPAMIQEQFTGLSGILPAEARQLLGEQMQRIAGTADRTLGWTAAGSLLFALFSAMKGATALIAALNIAYDEREDRGFIRLYLLALALTVGGILFAIASLALVAVFPVVVGYLPLPEAWRTALALLRWPVLAVLVMAALAVVYRYAPARRPAKWRWISWGSVAATVLWLIGSVLFSLYVARFAGYNETYGSLGAIVVLLMWFYLSAYVMLLGAEFNAETEHQTARDSTAGPDLPLGRREAHVADTVGRARF